jgi:hypothetical protein
VERDFQDAFYERVRGAEGKYVLEKSELKAIMDMDAAYIGRQSQALDGLTNLTRLEFSCFSFAYGDGSFRALASEGMAGSNLKCNTFVNQRRYVHAKLSSFECSRTQPAAFFVDQSET